MEKVTAYLCDKLSGKVECTNFEGEISAVSAADGVVKAKLWPKEPVPGCRIEGGEIIAQLLKENDSRYVCVYGEYLAWEREEILDVMGDPVGLRHYITIEIENPDHCHWIGSAILIFGADFNIFGRLFASVQVGSGGDPCPEDKDDVFSGGGKTQFLMTQNQIVPGEQIALKNYFWDGQNATEEFVDTEWFCTCCFSGGEVKAINGDYEDTDITYTVQIQGIEYLCVSSDFVEYEVGDWVFVLAPSSTCSECGRKEACREGCEGDNLYRENIGDGDGSDTSPVLTDLAHGANGICTESGKLPIVEAICGGSDRTVNIAANGICSGYCSAGQLNMTDGIWIIDITWDDAPDAGTDIEITYREGNPTEDSNYIILPMKVGLYGP